MSYLVAPSQAISPPPAPARPGGWLTWVLALLVLHLVFAFPHRLGDAPASQLLRLPVELPATVLVLALVPATLWFPFRGLLAGALSVLVVVKAANMAADFSLARPFNLLLDLHLAGASLDLLTGALGRAGAIAVFAVATLAWIGVLVALFWALGRLRLGRAARPRTATAAALVSALVGAAHVLTPTGAVASVTTAGSSQLMRDQAQLVRDGLRDRRLFCAELGGDPLADLPPGVRLNRLQGKDVLILFVESYGRSALEDPRYAPVVHAALEEFERAASDAGFQSRSAWMTAPIFGGQSWLAHATLLSGLKINHQRHYESLIVSERQTLVGDFANANWRTLAVMPAMLTPWPEGAFYGFDRVYQGTDLGYQGEPFNWVTMPDQFTKAALRRLELVRRDRAPVMATVALISSHAPWTPIPPLLDWDEVGDGSVFTQHARAGDPPAVVWRDPDRVRAQYLASIDYVLRTLKSYIATYGDDQTVFIVLGDHQPARIVTGDDDSLDVPIHILARSPQAMAAASDWGWSAGMRPADDAPVWRMEDFRQRLVRALTDGERTASGRAAFGTARQGD